MNICPAYKNLYALCVVDAAANVGSGFRPDILPLFSDEKIAYIKAIRANTPYRVSIRLFICHYYKDLAQNYCDALHNEQAVYKVCESNKTNYVFFYLDKSENAPQKGPAYLLIFTKAAQLKRQIAAITAEIKSSTGWLGISECIIQCYIFYSSTLSDTLHRDTLKNDFDKQCNDSRFSFLFQHISLNKKSQWLNVNGGYPKFSLSVQEM
jgi:hypothetical protein